MFFFSLQDARHEVSGSRHALFCCIARLRKPVFFCNQRGKFDLFTVWKRSQSANDASSRYAGDLLNRFIAPIINRCYIVHATVHRFEHPSERPYLSACVFHVINCTALISIWLDSVTSDFIISIYHWKHCFKSPIETRKCNADLSHGRPNVADTLFTP